jgi:hypothetical protein
VGFNYVSSGVLGLRLCQMFGIDPTHVIGIHISTMIGNMPVLTVDYAPQHPDGEHTQEFKVLPFYEELSDGI